MQPEHIVGIIVQRRRRDHLQLVRQEPSLISRKEKPFESRRVRTARDRYTSAGLGVAQRRFNS